MQSSSSNRIGSAGRGRQLSSGLAALIGGLHANVARANWGENWAEMTWGFGGIPVPGLDGWGLVLLPAVLVAVTLLLIAKRSGPRTALLMLVALAIPLSAYAATIAVPNVFVNGTPADANEVNANFDTLVTESNNQDARVTALEALPPGDITEVIADAGLSGGGTSGAVVLKHGDTSQADSMDLSGGFAVQDVIVDTYGHVTSLGGVDFDGRYYTQSQADGAFARNDGDALFGIYSLSGALTVNGTSVTGIASSGSQVGVWGGATSGSPRYGIYGNGGGATGTSYALYGTNADYGIYASGSTQAGSFAGEVYVSRDSSTTEPQLHLFETATDYARIKLSNSGSSDSWNISGMMTGSESSSWLRFGSSTWGNILSLRADGYVYINRLASGYAYSLCVSGSTAGYIGRCASSLRYKENVLDLHLGLETVMQLRPVTFRWKRDGFDDLGFVAEEVNALDPILATLNEDGEPEGVRYRQLTALLAKAIQEQQAQIEELQERIASLESE